VGVQVSLLAFLYKLANIFLR